jgi:hypothetical protein
MIDGELNSTCPIRPRAWQSRTPNARCSINGRRGAMMTETESTQKAITLNKEIFTERSARFVP